MEICCWVILSNWHQSFSSGVSGSFTIDIVWVFWFDGGNSILKCWENKRFDDPSKTIDHLKKKTAALARGFPASQLKIPVKRKTMLDTCIGVKRKKGFEKIHEAETSNIFFCCLYPSFSRVFNLLVFQWQHMGRTSRSHRVCAAYQTPPLLPFLRKAW